jgi:hypothetical protein
MTRYHPYHATWKQAGRLGARLLHLIGVLPIMACDIVDPPPPPPPPGLVSLHLDQAPAGIGGAIISVTRSGGGGGVIALGSFSSGLRISVISGGPGVVRLFVRGPLSPGLVAQLQVPDDGANYVVETREAAGGGSIRYVQLNPATVHFKVVR